MVNEEKVKMMAAVARDEVKLGTKRLDKGTYYKTDYIRSRVLSALGSFTVGYLLLTILVALYHMDYILVNFVSLNYRLIIGLFAGAYALLIFVCAIISYQHYLRRYYKIQVLWKKYYNDLRRLEEYYMSARKETGNDKAAGA